MSYTHCKGCGMELHYLNDKLDGLCAPPGGGPTCYVKWVVWVGVDTASHNMGDYADPRRQVSIDEWLELGMP